MHKTVSNNYQALTIMIQNLIRKKVIPPNPKILDFGCGKCQLIDCISTEIPLADLYGVDLFKNKNDLNDIKKKYKSFTVIGIEPYQEVLLDKKFDLIITNQVLEHIQNLNLIYKFFNKILKKNGLVIAAFPTKEIIFEPHLKIPFVHFIDKNSYFLGIYLFVFNLIFEFAKGNFSLQTIQNKTNQDLEFCKNKIFYLNKSLHIKNFRNYFQNIYDKSDDINLYWKENKNLSNFLKFILLKVFIKKIRISLTSRLIGSLFIVKK